MLLRHPGRTQSMIRCTFVRSPEKHNAFTRESTTRSPRVRLICRPTAPPQIHGLLASRGKAWLLVRSLDIWGSVESAPGENGDRDAVDFGPSARDAAGENLMSTRSCKVPDFFYLVDPLASTVVARRHTCGHLHFRILLTLSSCTDPHLAPLGCCPGV